MCIVSEQDKAEYGDTVSELSDSEPKYFYLNQDALQ